MTTSSKLFRIDPSTRDATSLREVDFAQLGLRERSDIQEWVAAHPDILGGDLLIVAKEFSGFDSTSERLDLLAVDSQGTLVVIELKRDDSGADAYWQAVKYASYLRHANVDTIAEMLADYAGISKEEAGDRLLKHLDADDLESLNREQRIILASHRFAPEVTSAVLWLNEKFAGESLITCVQLTPYHDEDADSLYLQANTIIPLPGEEEYIVQVGSNNIRVRSGRSFGDKLRERFRDNSSDEVTSFFRRVRDMVLRALPADSKPDRHSRWAGGTKDRYYKFWWYKQPPWKNWGFSYAAFLDQPNSEHPNIRVRVGLDYHGADSELRGRVEALRVHKNQEFVEEGRGPALWVRHTSEALDDDFANAIAGTFRLFVDTVTPEVAAHMEEVANQQSTKAGPAALDDAILGDMGA